MADSPIMLLTVLPVTLLPSCLKVKVRSIGPFPKSAVAFQLPVMSAAKAARAENANTASSRFMAKVYNCSDFEVMRTGLATVLFDVPETGVEDFLDAVEFGAPEVAR